MPSLLLERCRGPNGNVDLGAVPGLLLLNRKVDDKWGAFDVRQGLVETSLVDIQRRKGGIYLFFVTRVEVQSERPVDHLRYLLNRRFLAFIIGYSRLSAIDEWNVSWCLGVEVRGAHGASLTVVGGQLGDKVLAGPES